MKRLKKIFALVFVIALLVNNFAGVICVSAAGSEDISVDLNIYGPYLEKINYPGSFLFNPILDDGKFGDTWIENGFESGSTIFPMNLGEYVYLGDYDFTCVSEILITYCTASDFNGMNCFEYNTDVFSYIGLSKQANSFNAGYTEHDFSYAIGYEKLTVGTSGGWAESRTASVKNIDRTYNGSVWLTAFFYGKCQIAVTDITFVFEKGTTFSVGSGKVSNGTITLSSNGTVNAGQKITVTAKPAPGYKLYDILVNDTPIQGNSFSVTGDSVVTAAFVKENVSEGLLYHIKNKEAEIWDYIGTDNDVIIPEKIGENPVTSLGHEPFMDCNSIKSIFIPSSVKSIGNMAFYNCSSLASIRVDDNNNYFRSHEDVLFTKDYTELVFCPRNKNANYFRIPDGVTTIKETAFMRNKNIISIYIPESTVLIEDSAFFDTKITDVYYAGTGTDWGNIKIVKSVPQLANAKIHCNYVEKATEKPVSTTGSVTTKSPSATATLNPTETPISTESITNSESTDIVVTETPEATADLVTTETPETTSTPDLKDDQKADKSDGGLGTGAIIGIIALCIVIAGGAGAVIYFFIIKKK